MTRTIALATLVAGTLDIFWAMLLTTLFGREIGNMLRFVASGPYPPATDLGAAGAILGLIVHFALMAIMAAVYVLAASRIADMVAKPIKWGVLYGLLTYVVLNLFVVPLRFPASFPPKPLSIATQLFAHVVLVGIVFALVTARHFRPRQEPIAT
jgi:hypothetical protein